MFVMEKPQPASVASTMAAYWRLYERSGGMAPTVRELARELGRTISTTQDRLSLAVKYGFLRKDGTGKSRALRPVVTDGHCPLCGQERVDGG